ncbi:unnamed protein product, partial [Dovyalis caffra]
LLVRAIIDVSDGKLVLRVGDEEEIIYDDPLELCIIQGEENDGDNPIRVEQVACPEATEFMIRKKEFEEIDKSKEKRLNPLLRIRLVWN